MKDGVCRKLSKKAILAFLICFTMLAETAVPVFAGETKNVSEEPVAVSTEEVVLEEETVVEEAISEEAISEEAISEEEAIFEEEIAPEEEVVPAEVAASSEKEYVEEALPEEEIAPEEEVAVSKSVLSNNEYTVEVNDSIDIVVTGYDEVDSYYIADTSIATVSFYNYSYLDDEFTIRGVRPGKTTLYITTEYGYEESYIINVTAPEFTIDDSSSPTLSVEKGDYEYIYTDYPYDEEDCTYSIKNSAIARVEKSGYSVKLYGLKPGDTTMTVTNEYGQSITCKVHVYADITSLKFSKEYYTVYIGNSFKLPYTVSPSNHNNKITFSFPSYYDEISISEDGVVKGLKEGTVYGVEINSESYAYDDCYIIVKKPYFNKSTYKMYKNKTLTLKLNGGKNVKWSSSNKSVATVSSKGKVTAKKAGTTTISATSGGKTYKTTVKVSNPKLSKTKLSLWAGKSSKLSITGGVGKVTWKSSNKSVATVSKGKVVAKKAGTATISAKVSGVTLKCKVTVKGPQLSKTSKTLIAKQTYKLSVKGATTKVKWSSSNTKVATVSSKGTVTAKSAGKAAIYAKVGGKTLKCIVTVYRNQVVYGVDTDVNSYDYGEPTVVLRKAYFDGSALKVQVCVMNNRIFRADKFDWLIYKLYDNKGNLIASKKFTNISLYISPGRYKKITLTFTGDSIKRKNAILNYGVDDYWSYWYTYTY